jgi:spore maturation protein CgeB
MRCVFFYHAFSSCWNNGNAHFLRGIARELNELGHEVVVYEPCDGWSRVNAIRDGGERSLREVPLLFPGVDVRQYDGSLDIEEALDATDLVVVHEWNPPELIGRIGRQRARGARYTLFFHDTHHRAITAPQELKRFDLDGYDAVLAFGEMLRRIYLGLGWANRAYTWHEAADTRLYRPLPHIMPKHDVIWIGNWGDEERSAELRDYLIDPIVQLGLNGKIHGVRYPHDALQAIEAAGIEYGGWLPAHLVPIALAGARVTVHVPRAPYVRALPGIPTIRMFEAMACGIPVISAPWEDIEQLLPPASYLRVAHPVQMKDALLALLSDRDFAQALAETAQQAVRERHTCRHRALELLDMVQEIRSAHAHPAQRRYREAAQ